MSNIEHWPVGKGKISHAEAALQRAFRKQYLTAADKLFEVDGALMHADTLVVEGDIFAMVKRIKNGLGETIHAQFTTSQDALTTITSIVTKINARLIIATTRPDYRSASQPMETEEIRRAAQALRKAKPLINNVKKIDNLAG